jgi:hypothetical protein
MTSRPSHNSGAVPLRPCRWRTGATTALGSTLGLGSARWSRAHSGNLPLPATRRRFLALLVGVLLPAPALPGPARLSTEFRLVNGWICKPGDLE